MSLNDLIAADAKAVFLTDFAESIDYRLAAGTVLTGIKANIYREPLEKQGEDRGRSLSFPIEIEVAVADVPDVTAAGDAVKLKKSLDTAAVWTPVTAVLAQDAGLWRLAVGR